MRQQDFMPASLNPVLLHLPLFLNRVPAGFPSPATDYIEKRIDLNELLIQHPAATFYVRAEGDSMFPDICNGDLLVIDRSVEISNGRIVLASINGEFTVKRYYLRSDGSLELKPTNPDYKTLNLPDECDLQIFGAVVGTIKQFK